MRINENITGFQALRSQTRETADTEQTARTVRASAASISDAAGDDGSRSVLERVAAENLAASLSRIRDAAMAQQLASATAAQILDGGRAAISVQANVAPETVAALLQS